MFFKNQENKVKEATTMQYSDIEQQYCWEKAYTKLIGDYDVGQEYTNTKEKFSVYCSLHSLIAETELQDGTIYEILKYENKTKYHCSFSNPFLRKDFASKIKIQKVIPLQDLNDIIFTVLPMVENESEYEIIRNLGYDEFSKEKFIAKAISLGHSKSFANVIFPKDRSLYKHTYDKMICLNEEGISKDMMAFLFLK